MSIVMPVVDLHDWCRRWKIRVREHTCEKCGLLQKTTLPWATKEWRGLMAPMHDCGPDFQFATAVPVDPKDREAWRQIAHYIGGTDPR